MTIPKDLAQPSFTYRPSNSKSSITADSARRSCRTLLQPIQQPQAFASLRLRYRSCSHSGPRALDSQQLPPPPPPAPPAPLAPLALDYGGGASSPPTQQLRAPLVLDSDDDVS